MILVTGATGFLGHNLVTRLTQAGRAVRAFARPTSDTTYLRELGVEVAFGDVRDPESLARAAAGCRYIVHGAGLFRFWGPSAAFERVNAEGAANVLAAARRAGVERVVHVSTIVVVGDPPPGVTLTEETPCRPVDAYQRSKLHAEETVRAFQAETGLPVIILRPGAFYGPWGRYAFNRLFFEDPLKGLPIQVHHGRRLTFPVFAPDVAQAIIAALTLGQPGQVYNIAGDSLTQRQANEIVSRLAGISAWRLNVPAWLMLAFAGAWTRLAEVTGREPYYPINLKNYVFNDWRVSSARAQAELGFRATPFAEGAQQTLDWYWRTGQFRQPGRRT